MTQPKRKPGRPKAGGFGQTPANQAPYLLTPTNRKGVAEFLNVTERSIWAAMRVRAALEKRIADGWFCEHCGRRITKGRSDKRFCSHSCRGHYHRDAKALEVRFNKLMIKLGGHPDSIFT